MPEQLSGIPSGFVANLLTYVLFFQATLSPALVNANTTAEQTFSVTNLPASVGAGSLVVVSKPTAQAGLGIVGARVSAAGQVAITFSNNTAAGITPTASEAYTFLVVV